ncbi:MAG: coniferyl-alcohol dehydrogenase [Pseudomonadota bacterium]
MAQKTYAVTGVASGIGAELARILHGEGHRVIGFDVVATEPGDSSGVDRFITLDLSDPGAIVQAADHLNEPLDGLCNNAGLPPRDGLEAAILEVNFTGTRAFTNALLPRFRDGGSVVNMASRAGHGWPANIDQVKALGRLKTRDDITAFIASEGIDATRAYNLSKEAVILWTLAEAEPMVNRGLRVNSLSPGGIATGILDDFRRAFGDKMAKNVARAGRPGEPVEIAHIAAFLLSPASNWIKGTDIAIDGGMGAFNQTDAMGLDQMRL